MPSLRRFTLPFLSRRRKPATKANRIPHRRHFESLEDRIVLAFGVTNLGLAGDFGGLSLDGNLSAFSVSEHFQDTTDLNGDGDTSDSVVHVYDAGTNTTTNLGLDGHHFVQEGDLLAFLTSESSQDTDLNGDGDTSDVVVHVYDGGTKTTTNLGLDGSQFRLAGDLLAFGVSESRQDNTDLNGDGDTSDVVLHVYDAGTNTTTNVGLDGSPSTLDGDLIAFLVSESSQGTTDLNGDGDTSDVVLHVYDAGTNTTTNLGLGGSSIKLDGDLLAFQVRESSQGNTDLNGDGDTSDAVVHVYDAGTNTTTNLGLESFNFRLDGDLLAILVSELRQGNTDLNGDGDTSDSVVHVYDVGTNTTTNLGLDSSFIHLAGDLLAFGVSESRQDNTDLNGDGDTSDFVVHVYDAGTNTTTNLGLAGSIFGLDGDLLALSVSEFGQDNTDLNSDGDTDDLVLHVYDAGTNTTTNLGLDGRSVRLDGDLLAFKVLESKQGNTDLNGDGDTSDRVVHVYDFGTNTTTNLGLDGSDQGTGFGGSSLFLDADLLAFPVSEVGQGNTDLNGDGGTGDLVVHVVDMRFRTTITSPTEDDIIDTSPVTVTVAAEDNAGVTGIMINGIAATLVGGTSLDGTWQASVPVTLPVSPGQALTFTAVASNSTGFTATSQVVVDSDGIAADIDTDPNAFSDDFSDGTTIGSIAARNNWTVSVIDHPDPVLGIQATVTGSGQPSGARLVTCGTGAGQEQTTLDVAGETAGITCVGATSTQVQALVASPEIVLQEPPSGFGGNKTQVNLNTNETASLGSPVTADPANATAIGVLIVNEIDVPVGSGPLGPGQTLDIEFLPDGAIVLENLTPASEVAFTLFGTELALQPGDVFETPAIGPITAPVEPQALGTTVSLSAQFTDTIDPNVVTHTADWDWGDGTISAGIVTDTGAVGTGSVSGEHEYSEAGVYTVTLTVTDANGRSGQSLFQFIVVYDASAGFVSGGGWIDSPAGALVADPLATGKATFGFVSKYKKGASVPTGQTNFHFNTGNLRFHSDDYDWLVVAGPHAKFKGEGTINGNGNYGFMLTATDGDVNGGGGTDGFRIKIWDKNNGGVVVYDNQPAEGDDSNTTTDLGGGSITIQKGSGQSLQVAADQSSDEVGGGNSTEELWTSVSARDLGTEMIVAESLRTTTFNVRLDSLDVGLAGLLGTTFGLTSDSTDMIWLGVDARRELDHASEKTSEATVRQRAVDEFFADRQTDEELIDDKLLKQLI